MMNIDWGWKVTRINIFQLNFIYNPFITIRTEIKFECHKKQILLLYNNYILIFKFLFLKINIYLLIFL